MIRLTGVLISDVWSDTGISGVPTQLQSTAAYSYMDLGLPVSIYKGLRVLPFSASEQFTFSAEVYEGISSSYLSCNLH